MILLAAILAAVFPLSPAVRVATVQVAPPPPTVAVAAGARCGDWWQLAVDVGWPADELPTLDRVMWCESNCEPRAHNRSGASGLMQIMPGWWGGRDPFDPTANLTMAFEVFEAQGWRAWSCW